MWLRLVIFAVCIWIIPYFLLSLNMESETLEEEESRIIINAVKDANIPKFVAEDVPLFKSILADLFPGLNPPGPDNKLLKVRILSGRLLINTLSSVHPS